MRFNDLVDNILEDFKAPIGNNKKSKVLPGKNTNQNPQLGKPHSVKAISGFKGQPGGKIKTLKFKLPTKKSESKQQQPS